MYNSRFYGLKSGLLDVEIDKEIDAFQVFDDIIKNHGSISTIDDNIDKQPTRQGSEYFHCTLEEIAEQLDITQGRVRQIERKALRKIRNAPLGSSTWELKNKLKDFF